MPRRWRVLLPVIGLSLFANLSYHSVINNREADRTPSRYFWWDIHSASTLILLTLNRGARCLRERTAKLSILGPPLG